MTTLFVNSIYVYRFDTTMSTAKQFMQAVIAQRRQFSDDTNALGQSNRLSGLLTQLQHLNIGRIGLVEFECQQKYESIIAQLCGFLTSEDLQSAIKCITSEDLESKIKEIDDKWMGLRERQQVTLERLKEVVTTIRKGIFCGAGHIFYIRVRNVEKHGHSELNVYTIDIKDLSGNQFTENLYAYESDGTLVTDIPNPFNLTSPRLLGDRASRGEPIQDFLPYGIRLYAFALDPDDNNLKLILKDDRNRVVLELQFYYR
jgi:hypothetical protein